MERFEQKNLSFLSMEGDSSLKLEESDAQNKEGTAEYCIKRSTCGNQSSETYHIWIALKVQ